MCVFAGDYALKHTQRPWKEHRFVVFDLYVTPVCDICELTLCCSMDSIHK